MSHLSLSTPSAVLAMTSARPALSALPWASLLAGSDEAAVASSPALGPGFSFAALQALDALAELQPLRAGQLVYARGDVAHGLLALIDGEVALGEQRAGAAFHNECHVKAPAWLSLSTGWLAEPQAQDALALRPGCLLHLPLEPLRAVLSVHPGLAEAMIQALAREARSHGRRTQALMHQDAPARLAAWLCSQPTVGPSDEPGADPHLPGVDRLHLGLRKRDLASQLAITPETLSRLMRSFSQQGWLRVAGYTLYLLDRAALARVAGLSS